MCSPARGPCRCSSSTHGTVGERELDTKKPPAPPHLCDDDVVCDPLVLCVGVRLRVCVCEALAVSLRDCVTEGVPLDVRLVVELGVAVSEGVSVELGVSDGVPDCVCVAGCDCDGEPDPVPLGDWVCDSVSVLV